jgi:hypothetical protein
MHLNRHFKRVGLCAMALVSTLVVGAGLAQAAVVFFVNDAPGFASAMSGNTLLGTEDFEGSTLAPSDVTEFNDPLQQGVANGPYPAGLNQPMTVQSNLSGGSPTSPNPRGGDGLAAASSGFAGAASDIVIANFFVDSLDWLFNAADQIVGVGLNPLNFFGASTLEIRVFDTSNTLLGMTTVTGDPAGTNFLGIQATGGDLIGRINFFSLAGAGNGAEGGDNASLFTPGATPIPEPASLSLLGLGCGALFLLARRRTRRLS